MELLKIILKGISMELLGIVFLVAIGFFIVVSWEISVPVIIISIILYGLGWL